jgi:hypothetical protein
MGTYAPGDVLLARVRMEGRHDTKTRPVVVVASYPGGILEARPVTSRLPVDTAFLPIGLVDFEEGGLDICDESYVLLMVPVIVAANEVTAKKGRVSPEVLAAISHRREG